MRKVRLLNLGRVTSLRSQTLFHGIARAVSRTGSPVITLMSPEDPYVCVGYHQSVEEEIDQEYCLKTGIPIFRREIGGGAVFLDDNQIFYHALFPKDIVPKDMSKVYSLFLEAPVQTYRHFGIDAYHRPVNDIQVSGRKIGGTGAALIDDTMVIAGSIILDFDYRTMSRVLKVPDEKFRDKIYKSLTEYLTSMKRELGDVPQRKEIEYILAREFEKALEVDLVEDRITQGELDEVASLDRKFVDREWVFQMDERKKTLRTVKIAEGISVCEGLKKTGGGLVRVIFSKKDDILQDIVISGDFYVNPEPSLQQMEERLRGIHLSEANLVKEISKSDTIGIEPEELASIILEAAA